ncbi:MAG TPA: FAD/NAD(P)-binding oxidoreductase [Candidatus Sulfotelmatobacter sp.]|nr:FAD/NAD(P)-binding oxidoreductase [Candidatus Sulfotelmatobacter sp.]
MSSSSQHRFEVLVVGGGPAGIAAAVRAAESGTQVGIVDDNAVLGGQIWRGVHAREDDSQAAGWRERFLKSGVAALTGLRVFHQPESGLLLAESVDDLHELGYDKLILATGARERFLPFPGWTLPNVMGAGGLHAMVKSSLPIRGKKIVVAGTGPLLLAVAANLRKHGGEILMVCEQASWASLARFGASLSSFPSKIGQVLQLRKELAGIQFRANCWPVAASGQGILQSVTLACDGKQQLVPCDYLACGFHLVPNVELPSLLGCRISGGFVPVDDGQETSLKGIYCAGEPTGIGGVELALVEGQIAGLAATGQASEASKLSRERAKGRQFARSIERAFRLRPELKKLVSGETIVCRCEDIRHAQLAARRSWREAKLHTRCGMGPCQGRICGPATEFLFGWKMESVRPPVFPARVGSLAGTAEGAPFTGGVR